MPQASEHLGRLGLVTLTWFVSMVVLSRYAALWLPAELAQQLTLQSYLATVQIVTLGLGLSLSVWLLKQPRVALGLNRVKALDWLTATLLSPVVLVGVSYLAFEIAKPTLLQELAEGGRRQVEQNSGAFGRQLSQAPLALTLFWGALLAPVCEEFAFRGALWSLLFQTGRRWLPDSWQTSPKPPLDPLQEAAPQSVGEAELLKKLQGGGISASWLMAVARWLAQGGLATLVSTLLFAAFHADMPGGVGIVRLWSAAGLGLSLGLLRQHTGTLGAPILLHVLYNFLSIGTNRRWFVTETFKTQNTVPVVLMLIAAGCLLAWGVVLLTRRRTGEAGRAA